MRVIKTSSSAGADALAMAAVKAGLAPPALKAARLWLAEQLVAYEYAKLGQGGHTNTQVPLRRVFVDLPVTASQSAMPQHEDRPLFLAQLLTSAPLDLRIAFSRRVDNSSPGPSSEDVAAEGEVFEPGNVRRHRHSGWGATLLIGGPGQGKSTLGQLACQLHRAALIKPHEQELPSSQRDLVRSFVPVDLAQKDRRKQPPLGLPKSPFLPLQIALPELAAWFARQELRTGSDEAPALLRFLADLPSAKMFALGAQDLFALASNMPSLLVLDGFDEVGATQDRETIVSAARELLTALARRSASSQIVATTRPQGYADELAQIGIRFEKRYLAPLQRAEALEYARKLVEAKIPGVDQRQKALAQIHEAASEPATERLLTTPLQVTILTALVQQQGRVPRERWNLFSRYFAYMYDREIEHGTSASALLAQHRTHIERIHARVALLLQVEAERGGGASARMTRVRFAEVIEAVLSEDEVSESERTYLVGAIASAAENRLVFLVEPEPGKFGFDIRSLQEFMAATALTSGRDTEVEARLLQIAKAPMFRNVALFVASRLFSEGSPLRDVLADRVCGSLDEDLNDEFGRISRAGAMLALETLEEGAVLSQPKRARALMARAVGLLSLPAGSEHVRLARAATADTISVLRESIERYLSALETAHLGTAAWVCLVDAANRAEPWAVELGDKLWPPQFASRLLFQALGRVRVPLGPWLANKIEGSAETISPEEFIDMPAPLVEPGVPSNWVSWLVNVYGYRGHWRRRQTSGLVGLVSVRDTDDHMQVPSTRAPAHATWTAWINAARYELNPNASSLAAALEKVADLPTSQWINLQWRCSWPLVSCLTAANIPSDLKRYASELLLKNLGDTEAWLSAEHTWKDAIDLPAVLTDISESVPWNLESIKRAPPFLAVPAWAFIERASSRTRKPPASAVLKQANAAFHASRSQSLRERLADICLILWKGLSAKAARDAPSATDWVKASSIGASVLVPRPKFLSRNDWLDLLNASRGERIQPWIASGAAYFDALVEEPAHPVLLRLATMSVGLYSEHFPLGEEIKSSQVKTYAEALTSQTATSVSARADLATLQVFLGAVSTEREADVVRSVSDAAADDQGAWSRLMSALDVSRLPRPRIQALLLRIYAEIRPDDAATHAAVKQIRDALQKRTSDLDSQATWNRLALPLPYPQQPLQARLEGGIPARPVRIESMELNDIGGIQDLILPFKPPGDGQGQWVVILGPNGVGKTTLLRSLALALRSVKHPGIWPRGAFASSWQRVLKSMKRLPMLSRAS